MEREKGSREKAKNIDTSLPRPHSLLRKNLRKRFSISLSTSLCAPLQLNSRESPDLFTCHSCGIRDGELQTLDSQWRIVLLCHGCLARIRSADLCSYCFNGRDIGVLVCRSCLCRVHLGCIPFQRGYILLSELDPVSFTCIDCCAIPRRQFRNPHLPRVLLENLVRNVNFVAKKKVALAARARLKALTKADRARVAMELAFDAIIFARDAAVEDEKLAMQLHQAMNGSPRIMRRANQAKLERYLPNKKDCGNGNPHSLCSKFGRGINEKDVICRKDAAIFESNNTSSSERNSYIKPGIAVENKLLEIDAHYESGSTEVTLAKKRRHFDDDLTLLSCRESADSNSFIEA